jgi:predicted choloylglycine hydrolase
MSLKYRARMTLILIAMITALAVLSGCTQKPVKPTVIATCGAGRLERWGMTKVVYLVGDPYQRGLQQGTLLKAQVRAMTKLADMIASGRTDVPPLRAEFAAGLLPDELAEMKGIAEGAGVEYESVLDANFAYEYTRSMGCSQFAAIDETGAFVVGRNLDYHMATILAKGRVLQVVVPDRGVPYFAPSLAGLAGVLTGINSQGIYAAIDAIPGAEQAEGGVPVSITLRRLLLTATSLDQATDLLKETPVSVGYKLLVVSGSERRFVSPEIGVTQSAYIPPKEGESFLVVTNHYVDPDMVALVRSTDDDRQAKLEQALAAGPALDEAKGIELLSLVEVQPPQYRSSYTLQSLVWLPDRDEAWLSNSTLPATQGRFICFHPREMLNSELPPQ